MWEVTLINRQYARTGVNLSSSHYEKNVCVDMGGKWKVDPVTSKSSSSIPSGDSDL